MTLVTIDLGDVAGGHHPDDYVTIRAEAFRESRGGGITSTAEVKIPLVNGVGQAEVEPGPVVVAFRCQAVADTREKRGVVPSSGTVGIERVLEGDLTYTPPVVDRVLEMVLAAAKELKWLKGTATELGITSADSAPEGIVSYFASHATAWGLPRSGAGAIQTVGGNQTIWVQEDGIAETWQRAYAGGVWREWRQVSNNVVQFGSAGFTSVDDLPTGSTVGFFASQSQGQGLPLSGAMTVITLGGFQLALGVASGRNEVWMRAMFSSGWNDWVMLNDRWARHNLTAGADLFTVPYDTYGVNTSALAESLGLPVRAIGTLEVMPMNATGNLRTLRFTTWNQSDTQVWVCSQRNVGEFGAWHRIDEGANVALAHETVDAEARQIAGSPLVHGTAVALVFDHGTNVFQEQLLPLLRARNIPATIALNSQMYNPAEVTRWEHDNRTTWAMVKSWWDNDGIEIANHGRTHKTINGDKELFHEIVGSLEELKANLPGVPITSWVQHAGVPAVTSHADYTDRVDGRYIYANHAAMTSAITPQRWPLSGSPRLGMSRFWIDNPTSITSTKNLILGTPVGWGTMVSGHPEEWGKQGNSTISDIESFLDWLVVQRAAGRITLLTMRELAYARPADADLGRRVDLLFPTSIRAGQALKWDGAKFIPSWMDQYTNLYDNTY